MTLAAKLHTSLLLALGAAPAMAGEIIVDATGGGDAVSLTDALAVAQDGDLLLVRPGTYLEDVVIQGLSVTIVAQYPDTVEVEGRLTVQGLSALQHVMLHGLRFEGRTDELLDAQRPALEGSAIQGSLTAARCDFVGAAASDDALQPLGGAGASLDGVERFTARACSFTGGAGVDEPTLTCNDGDGGDGLSLNDSRAALWGCSLRGGDGMGCDFDLGEGPGEGGSGARAGSSRLFLDGCDVAGGRGGDNRDFLPLPGGDGGDGVLAGPLSRLILVDSTVAGGQGGDSFAGASGQGGAPFSGAGSVRSVPGAAEDHDTPILVRSQSVHPIEVRGEPGAEARLHLVPRAPFFFDVARRGGVLPDAGPTARQGLLLGTIPASGVLNASVGIPALPAGATTLQYDLVVVTRRGPMRSAFGAPLRLVAIQCSGAGPDCDGNGRSDLCDLLDGAEDCDLNGVPDVCQADCNGNGVADPCDIASGTSLDLNGDGIPDECQPTNASWYVDPAAAPGGDGSAAAPFRNMAEAFAVALSGDEVLLADGLYRGANNRDLELGNVSLTVRSLNGPAGCVIDLEGLGRAFHAYLPPSSVRPVVEGLTIRNGHPDTSGPANGDGGAIFARQCAITIRDCVFEGNEARTGGAVKASAPALSQVGPRILGCVFLDNRAVTSGALDLSRGAAEVDRCAFTGNLSTGVAGAVRIDGDVNAPAVLSRCRFLANTGLLGGGAVYTSGGLGGAAEVHFIDQCLFAGNFSGTTGGAIGGAGGALNRVAHCTLVGNDAAQTGGGIALEFGTSAAVVNSILRGNTSGAGFDQVTADGPSSSLEVRWCNLQGGAAALTLTGGSTLVGATDLIDADPLFEDPAGPDGDPLTVTDNDYRLGAGSPSVDAADVGLVPPDRVDVDGDGDRTEEAPTDLDGLTRRVDDPAVPDTGAGPAPAVDHGPFERQ
ncbi:MAG: hypothetical protein PVJ89_10690 [Planctomycetota bacterium]|jgi:hypothetical protein